MPGPPFTHADLEVDDWIRYRGPDGKERLAVIATFYGGGQNKLVSAVTPDGLYVLVQDVLEFRRSPTPKPKPTVTPLRPRRRR